MVRRDRYCQALGRPDRDDKPEIARSEVSHSLKTQGRQITLPPFCFAVSLNGPGLARGGCHPSYRSARADWSLIEILRPKLGPDEPAARSPSPRADPPAT